MDNNEIEQKLKESAGKIKIKDFADRKQIVFSKIDALDEEVVKVHCKESVLVSNNGVSKNTNKIMMPIVVIVSFLFLVVIILSSTLPKLLNRDNDKRYFYLGDLFDKITEENEFYQELEKSNIKIADISKYDIDSYHLLIADDNNVMGGFVELIDDEEGFYVTFVFYTESVKSDFELGLEFNEYNINSTCIKFKTQQKEDVYSTDAITKCDNVYYELNCLSFDENILPLFDKLFGE